MNLFCTWTSEEINCGVRPQGFSTYWAVRRQGIVVNDSTWGETTAHLAAMEVSGRGALMLWCMARSANNKASIFKKVEMMCGSKGMQMLFKNEIKIRGWIGVSRARSWSILFLIISSWAREDDKKYLQRIWNSSQPVHWSLKFSTCRTQ